MNPTGLFFQAIQDDIENLKIRYLIDSPFEFLWR